MRVELFQKIPQIATNIRGKVFIEEQGFQEEFDDIDLVAVHFILFDDSEKPIATCRVFKDSKKDTYILGRLAVTKEYRGKHVGSLIVKKAEEYVKEIGGNELQLHAQCRITAFYNKIGYTTFGEEDEEEGCPHIWMRKVL